VKKRKREETEEVKEEARDCVGRELESSRELKRVQEREAYLVGKIFLDLKVRSKVR
jgi:hypothetical protein